MGTRWSDPELLGDVISVRTIPRDSEGVPATLRQADGKSDRLPAAGCKPLEHFVDGNDPESLQLCFDTL
jgi:hypothetical protein